MITINNGNKLIVKDSQGTGKISYNYTGAGDLNFGWGSYTIANYGGSLVIENGTIEILCDLNATAAKHMYCAIYQYSGSTTVNGGTISNPTYRSARLWKGDMTINDGVLEGQLWVQAVDNTSVLTINGGSFAPRRVDGSSVFVTNSSYDVTLKVTAGTFETNLGCSNYTKNGVKGSVSGGVFGAAIDENLCAEGFHTVENDGKYYVVEAETGVVATTAEDLAAAVANATSDVTISIANDITGDVVLPQKEGVNVTILGNNKTFTGVMTVFGKGSQKGAETMTIKDINFVTDSNADACILSPDRSVNNLFSYSHNVTVENCTFTGHSGCAAIRHNDGGDMNWTVKNCVVDNTMHSFFQVNNVEGKLVVNGCKAYSKNGANLNSTTNLEMTGCEFDVRGYAVRFGVNSGGNLGVAKNFTFTDNTLKSACEDGDAVIILRKSAVDAVLNFINTEVIGTTQISGNTDATTINGTI